MKQTLRKNSAIYLLGLLVIFACAPLGNLLNPTEPPPVDTAATASALAGAQTPSPTGTLAPTATPTLIPVIRPTATPQLADVYAFIQAPEGPLAQPYVTLIAFQSVPDASLEIRGVVNSNQFVCRGSPCALPVPTSSIVAFSAVSSTGLSSEEISATVRVELRTDGYYVFLDSVSQFASFTDSCLRFWGFRDFTDPVWAEFVQFPYALNTNKTLHYLTTQLIVHGIVDVSGCPAGGLSVGLDWPTGCGLERAQSAMIEWQNQYDDYIWLASKDVGIPPKILKSLIEVESQFWPGNERFYVDEVGLGQLNQLGVDVLLRRNPALFQDVCSTVLDDCEMPYSLMSSENQAMIRGAFINSQNAFCPTCENGLDLNKAKQSISFIAQVLRANCETVKIVTDANRPAGYIDDLEDPYSDFWKFTLLAYHGGVSCFENAVKETPKGLPLSWENLSENVDCASGASYVDGVWANLLTFDQYRYRPVDQQIVQVSPIFAPTRTPFPTAVISSAEVVVQVFLDSNQNGVPEDSEWLNDITVMLQASEGTEMTDTTVDGQVVFQLAPLSVGSDVTISLPDYYRSQTITVPLRGTVPVTFIFNQPTLPTAIP